MKCWSIFRTVHDMCKGSYFRRCHQDTCFPFNCECYIHPSCSCEQVHQQICGCAKFVSMLLFGGFNVFVLVPPIPLYVTCIHLIVVFDDISKYAIVYRGGSHEKTTSLQGKRSIQVPEHFRLLPKLTHSLPYEEQFEIISWNNKQSWW